MKKFSFPLERLLAWRHAQTRLEEAALEKLRAELQALDHHRTTLDQSIVAARDHLLGSRWASGLEIAALEHFRAAQAQESVRLEHTRASLVQRIAQQTVAVAERRRDARLLEKLRERRLAQWRQSADRELELLAEEAYMSKFARSANG